MGKHANRNKWLKMIRDCQQVYQKDRTSSQKPKKKSRRKHI